ncbi:MAG: hypothetical protein EOO11_05180 [Chitinophagaceae bacterium]|nr:MAG: hypothetical protein EOO11_05180 [Chitinophagaceae bacterium]
MKKIIFAALLLAAFSCKKSDNDDDTGTGGTGVAPARDSLFGTYIITAETTNGQNSWNTTSHAACEMDNSYTLNPNGTAVISEEGNVCAGGGNVSGAWEISGTMFTFNGVPGTVLSFQNSHFVVRKTVSVGGSAVTRVVTYSRI